MQHGLISVFHNYNIMCLCVEHILLNPLKMEQKRVYNQRKSVLFFIFPLEIGFKTIQICYV